MVQPEDAYLCFVAQKPLGQHDAATLVEGLKLFKSPPDYGSESRPEWSTLLPFDEDRWSCVTKIDLAALKPHKNLQLLEDKFKQAEKTVLELKKLRKTTVPSKRLDEQEKRVKKLEAQLHQQQELVNKRPAQPNLILQNCLVIDDKLLDLLFTRSLMTRQFARVKPSKAG